MLLTPLGPIALSFDKKVNFFKRWKWALLAAVIVAIPYLIWDEFFTQNMVWGFNEKYLVGLHLGHLPIEEVSFFIVVPFACTFIFECVRYYFRDKNLDFFNSFFWALLFAYAILVGEAGAGKWYTTSAIGLGLILIIYFFIKRKKHPFIPLTFLFSMLPFFLVNGILTGSFLEDPIVWYNDLQFSTLRIFTIPMEDVIYGFGLIVLNVLLFDWFRRKFGREEIT